MSADDPLLAAFLAGARWGIAASAEVVDALRAEDMTLAARLDAAGHQKLAERQLMLAGRLATAAAEIRVQQPDAPALPVFRAWVAEFEGGAKKRHFGGDDE